MTVDELIDVLHDLPRGDLQVLAAYDGEARTPVECAWVSNGGEVVLAGFGETIHSEESRPLGVSGDGHWKSPTRIIGG